MEVFLFFTQGEEKPKASLLGTLLKFHFVGALVDRRGTCKG